MLSKLLLIAASKNFGSNHIQIVPHWIIYNRPNKIDQSVTFYTRWKKRKP